VAGEADVKAHTFEIDGHTVGGEHVFIIAEIGNNHNGSIELARKLVDASIQAGADCVKFQLRNREALYRVRTDGSVTEDLGVEYIQDLLNKVEFTVAQTARSGSIAASGRSPIWQSMGRAERRRTGHIRRSCAQDASATCNSTSQEGRIVGQTAGPVHGHVL
jgi:hypothetical protein